MALIDRSVAAIESGDSNGFVPLVDAEPTRSLRGLRGLRGPTRSLRGAYAGSGSIFGASGGQGARSNGSHSWATVHLINTMVSPQK